MSNVEVESYRASVSGLRALFACGLTQDFFNEDRARIPAIMEALNSSFADLEERFGVRILGTLDDDELTGRRQGDVAVDLLHPRRGARPRRRRPGLQPPARDRGRRRATMEVPQDRGTPGTSALLRRTSRMSADGQRVAIVTGAAQGLGEAIAKRFLAETLQGRVRVTSTPSWFERTARAYDPSGEQSVAVDLDVRRLESVETCLGVAVERWGHVDAWVNNAARTVARPFLEIDPDEWDDVVTTNLRGTYFGCRVAGIHMCERGSGSIINLASRSRAVGTRPHRRALRGLKGGHRRDHALGGDRVRPAGSHRQRRSRRQRSTGRRPPPCLPDTVAAYVKGIPRRASRPAGGGRRTCRVFLASPEAGVHDRCDI